MSIAFTRNSAFLSVLDIGSSKIVCIIARLQPIERSTRMYGRTHTIDVLGFGIQQSKGVRSGVIVNLDAAEQSIRLAVDAAEHMSGLLVDSVIVNFSCRGLCSNHVSKHVSVCGRAVTTQDIQHVLSEVMQIKLPYDRQVLHSLPVVFKLDKGQEVDNPKNMMGNILGVVMHIVTVNLVPLRNLEHCINRAHLSVEKIVSNSFASGLSVLEEDEAKLGAICIDFGAGTTTLSVFDRGKFIFNDVLPVGSNHITLDIARGLSLPVEEAERLKVMQGSALWNNNKDDVYVSTLPPRSGENYGRRCYSRSMLSRIITARVEEILEMVHDRLTQSGIIALIGQRLVLTGGGAQMIGLPELASNILGKNLRIGRPLGISGLPDEARGGAFSTATGLLVYPQFAGIYDNMMRSIIPRRSWRSKGYFWRVGRWIRESF